MTQVFISYSRKDLEFVQRLADDLRNAGLEVWYDLSGLDAGTRWGSEIQKAIQASKYFLVVMSPNSIISEWVENEFLYAKNQNLKIIPLLLKTCDLPMWSLNLHFIDVHGSNYLLNFQELLKALGVEKKPFPEEQALPVARSFSPAPVTGSITPDPQVKRKPLFWRWIWLPVLAMFVILAVTLYPRLQGMLVSPMPTQTLDVSLIDLPTSTVTRSATITQTKTPYPTEIPPMTTAPTIWPIPDSDVRVADGMGMVNIPAGEFSMGSLDGDANEQPVHLLTLDAFWIDQTEVTNAMYAKCVKAGICDPPSYTRSNTRLDYYGNPAFSDYPVIYVSWDDSDLYCKWAGGRLPTEPEWEKAARGGIEGQEYLWGNNSPSCIVGSVNGTQMGSCGLDDTRPVASFGANEYGIYDMAGNVSEWIYSQFGPYPYEANDGRETKMWATNNYDPIPVFRGGSWNDDVYFLRTACRAYSWSSTKVNTIGFRCVRDESP